MVEHYTCSLKRKEQQMGKHLNENERARIEILLNMRWSIASIAKELRRPDSTILREIQNRRVRILQGYGCSNRLCKNFDTCSRIKGYGQDPKRLFRTISKCYLSCPEYRENICARLGVAPYVCNGCEKYSACPLKKHVYLALNAQANYSATLRESRTGIRPDDVLLSELNKVLSPCILRKQSIKHIIASNPALFGHIAERTLYSYIEAGLFDARSSDLPDAGQRRKGKRKAETKTNAKCRVGRTQQELFAYREANPDLSIVEMDTVIGQNGGKVLFTFQINSCGLMLAFLRDAKTSQTCTRIINMLWKLAGAELFREIFAIIVTDNGPEFSDPGGIELYRPDPEHNPLKLLPRGIKLFYCDSYCSCQKPHVERNHREVRRILEHGTSFNTLTQDDINLVMSHVNSYTREWLGNKTPYDTFLEQYGEPGEKFLNELGIRRIPGNQVTLDPMLLGAKFKRHADKVILDKYGVKQTGITNTTK